jgi:cobalt-zinc-cadmium efflux system outer membrane protein
MNRLSLAFLTICFTPLRIAAQMDGMSMPMSAQAPASAPSQNTRNAAQPQEREAPEIHTGDDLAAPDLLADAKQRPAITLQQLEAWALAQSPAIAAAQAAQQRSVQLGRQAALPPNPTVGYSGDQIRGGSYGGGEQGVFVQQTVVLGGKLGLHRDVYQQQAAADATGIQEQTLRVRADVQMAFYAALAAQRMAASRQQLLNIAQDAVDNAHRTANVGQVDAPDVLNSEVDAEQAKIEYVDAQRAYLARFRELAVLCNQPSLPVSPLTGELDAVPDLNTDAAVAKALTESPEIQRTQQGVAVAQAQVKQASRAAVPNLNVQAGEWHSGEQLNNINKQAGWMSFAQVGVELPLWNRNQGGTAAAQAEVQRAQADAARTRLRLQQTEEIAAQQYLSARFQAERYRTQLLPRARRAYDLYNMKYQQMAAPYAQVLESQRRLAILQIAYTHALEQAWKAAITLQTYALHGALNADMAATNMQGEVK